MANPLCVSCKKVQVSSPRAKRCVSCYMKRSSSPQWESKAKVWICEDCQQPCTRGAKRCVSCYTGRGPYSEGGRERKRKADIIREIAEGTIIRPEAEFEAVWKQWMQTIGMMRERYKGPKKPRKDPLRKRILVIPDLHVPYHEPEMVADMIARESGRVDLAICIGDISDSYSLSRFAKYESVPYAHEWAEVTGMMQLLSESFPEVKVIIGNHDARLRRNLANHLTADMVEAVSAMAGGTLCPITALARKFPNVSVANHPVPNSTHTVDWLHVEGDALLGHPEKYSRVSGTALRFWEEWAADNAAAMGLSDIRLLVMGHTHALGIFPWRSDKLLVECGCLCKTQGYMTAPKIGGRPQRRSYVWFEQVDGITDLNSIGYHWYDVEDGPWR